MYLGFASRYDCWNNNVPIMTSRQSSFPIFSRAVNSEPWLNAIGQGLQNYQIPHPEQFQTRSVDW